MPPQVNPWLRYRPEYMVRVQATAGRWPLLKVTATTTCTHISRTLTSLGLWPV